MSNTTQQWIPLTGPGGRLPTRDDADNDGCVYYLYDAKTTWRALFSSFNGKCITHFCPIPKAPPLPKPVEKTQDEKDELAAVGIWKSEKNDLSTTHVSLIKAGVRYGRAQLAREALGLFTNASKLGFVSEEMFRSGYRSIAEEVNHLHELLTKAAEASAAEEKP